MISGVSRCLTCLRRACARVHEQGNNETVKTQHFGENEDQNHSNEQSWLLSGTTDTSITDNTNGKSSSETSETDRQTSTELNEASEQGGLLLKVVGDQDRHDETVNGNDTSHNDRNNVLDNQVRPENTHRRDTDASLGGSVRGAEAGEDDGACAAHRAEERGIHGAEIRRHLA